jgi:hypothetical protein
MLRETIFLLRGPPVLLHAAVSVMHNINI